MDDMWDGLMALAAGDPTKMDEYRKMPVVEYYALLDARIEEVRKQKKQPK